MINLVPINSIGLTGNEIFCNFLNKLSYVRVLPGQNFVISNQSLYRPHMFENLSMLEIFTILTQKLYTKDGRMWIGLTKFFTPNERKNFYNEEHHKDIFINKDLKVKLILIAFLGL